MDWTWYLFGFKGRINRAKYWLAGFVMLDLVVALAGLIYLAMMINFVRQAMDIPHGTGELSLTVGLDDVISLLDPATWRAVSLAKVPMLLIRTAATVFFVWIFLATTIKRLHDRDKSGWWMVPFFAVPGLYNQFADRLPDSHADLPLAIAASALCLWGFIEMCCLKGSRKTNRFGADPLTPKPPLDTRPPWDQQSEIEMVPKAGPPPAWRVKPMA